MNQTRRQALLVFGLMVGTAALARVGKPHIKLADQGARIDLEAVFPKSFGNWQVDANTPVILPAPDVQAKLDAIYNQVLSRTYVDANGYRIMLSVAYGGDQSDGMSIHLPETCYPAQGFQVSSNEAAVLNADGHSVPVHRLETRLGSRFEPVTYWITIGDRVAASRSQQKLIQIRFGLKGLIPDGMLVRISSIDRDTRAAQQRQAEFANDMARAIPSAFKPRVLGTVS